MKKQTKLIWGLVIALIAVIFVLLNTESVTINFGFVQPRVPLIIVLIVMTLIGAFFAWILARQDFPEDEKKLRSQMQKQEQDLERKITERDQQIESLKEKLAQVNKTDAKSGNKSE